MFNIWAKIKHKLSDPRTGSNFFYIKKPPAGINVTHENALTYSAVWSCVRVISETVSSLSCNVFERVPDGGKKQQDGQLNYLLSTQANPEMTAVTFKETLTAWTLLHGNGYAEIERDVVNRVKWMWPIHPDRVEPERDENGDLVYVVKNHDGSQVVLQAANMFHMKGLGYDGTKGHSVVGMAANAISLGMACETYGARYFGSGTNPGSVFEIPGKLSQEAYDRLKEDLVKETAGISNSKTNLILEEGMTYKHLAVPPEDSQFIETRKLQIEDIARFFRMPLHKMADLTNSSFSNIEQQSIEFVTDTIWPWVTRFESEANIKLFPQKKRGKFFCKINLNSLLRGDVQTRAEYYRTMVNIGVMTVNEIRGLEDMNPIGPDGDKHYMQLNMTTLDKIGKELPSPQIGDDDNIAAAHGVLFRDAFMNLAKFEQGKISGGMKRYPDRAEFAQWLKNELQKHRSKVVDRLTPPTIALYKAITKGDDITPILDALIEYGDRYITDTYDTVMHDGQPRYDSATIDNRADALIEWVSNLSAIHMRIGHEEKDIN